MFGARKKVEQIRRALIDALTARARELVTTQPEHWQIRAYVLSDVAGILASLTLDHVESGDE